MTPQTAKTRASAVGKPESGFVDNYLPYLIGRAGFEINRSFNRLLRDHDVAPSEWRVLAALNDRSMLVGELAPIVLLKQPTLTKLLDSMESKRYVQRKLDADDRRKVQLNLTSAGRKLANRLTKLALAHEQEMLATIPHLNDPKVDRGTRWRQRFLCSRRRSK